MLMRIRAFFRHRWWPRSSGNPQDPFVADFSALLNDGTAAHQLWVPRDQPLWEESWELPPLGRAPSSPFQPVPATPPQGTAVYCVYAELTELIMSEVLLDNFFNFGEIIVISCFRKVIIFCWFYFCSSLLP